MAVFVSLCTFFGNYTVVLVAVVSLLLWVLLSTPGKTCPFGNHLPRPAPDLVTKALAAETEVPTGETPKKKSSKDKKCSGKACAIKQQIEDKILKIFHSSDDEAVSFAHKLDLAAQEAGFECSLISLETHFDIEKVLLSDRRGANVFILSGEQSWFADWLFDPEKSLKTYLTELKFTVLAVGAEDNKKWLEWDRRLWRLGGLRLKKMDVVENENDLDIWMDQFMTVLTGNAKKQCCGTNGDKGCSSDSSCGSDSDDGSPKPLVDVEDLLLPAKK